MAISSGLWRVFRDDPFPCIQLLAGATAEERRESVAAVESCDILVVTGGLGSLDEAIPALVAKGLPTIYVLGSSELVGRDAADAVEEAKALAAGSAVHVLEKETVVLRGVRFVGTTLWTSFDEWRPALAAECLARCPDFKTIDASSWWSDPAISRQAEELCRQAGLPPPNSRSAQEATAFHPALSFIENRKAVSWLSEQLSVPFDGPTVVVSENPPVRAPLQAVPHYRADDVDSLGWQGREDRKANACLFAGTNDLRWLLRRQPSIDVWMHGRIPAHSDVVSEGVRIVSRSGRCTRVDDELSFGDILSRSLATRMKRKGARNDVGESLERANAIIHPPPVQLEAGLAAPLSESLLPLAQKMKKHEVAVRNVVPLTMSKSSIHRACIRRVIHEEMEGFAQMAKVAAAIERDLVASDDRWPNITFLFSSVDAPRGYPTEMSEPTQYDYYSKADRLSAQIDEVESLPFRAATQLALWCDRAHDVLATLASDQIEAMVVRPPIAALRIAACAAFVEVVVVGDKAARLAILHRLVAAHPPTGKLQPAIRVLDAAALNDTQPVLLDLKKLKEITDNISAAALFS
ncbi:hypothetical protein B0G80_2123 [Paraburkholderia sp. BL6669N2]|uniref:hypothetical protein n=1 Tax=Paraburkholderia sp. BL6669N2 TaxID=1938807 RepID=UPI000E23CE8B|nr:hypothetical protein [Paraburkholderia sp. BL6669N2]REG59374.1 hypothetical protein B0G80_2123 [Paraburkholderia sp. BL6669N2]